MELTSENYYSAEADRLMSCSQWKVWIDCSARAHAQFIRHEYRPQTSKAMAIGSLVDALLLDPADVDRVFREHGQHLIGKKGDELQDAKDARAIAEFVKRQDWFMAILDGAEKQVSLRFELCGMQWKARLDLINRDSNWIWDLKTTSDLWQEAWTERLGMRSNFLGQWQYCRQLALYREAARQALGEDWQVGIAAIGTGTETPDLALFPWDSAYVWQLDDQIRQIRATIPAIQAMREANPSELHRCERCEWCRQTRRELIISYHDPIKTKGDF